MHCLKTRWQPARRVWLTAYNPRPIRLPSIDRGCALLTTKRLGSPRTRVLTGVSCPGGRRSIMVLADAENFLCALWDCTVEAEGSD